MRILFIISAFTSGGSERVVSILATRFAAKYETEIICMRSREAFYVVDERVRVVFADDFAEGWLNKMLWLRRYVQRNDVVIAFMAKIYTLVLVSLLGKRSTVIASERNDPRHDGLLWKLMRKLILGTAKALVVQTNTIKESFPTPIQKKTHIILNPVEKSQYSDSPWDSESKMVLAVGRADSQKNYPMMIHAFSRLTQKHPDFHLEIWGNRNVEKKEHLQRLIDQAGATNSISVHNKTNNVAELYERAYMFVMSSNYEGLSNSLLEALCSGLPVISTRVSGATDVITHGENGLLVETGDEQGLCEAMKQLIVNPCLAKKFSEKARMCKDKFDVDNIYAQWEQLIKKTIEETTK